MTAVSRGFVGIGMLLLVSAAVVAFQRPDVSDTSCGTVFYDSYRDGVCRDRMATLTGWTVALFALGTAAVVTPVIVNAVRHGRPGAAMATVLAVGAVALGLFGLNRMLEPNDSPHWCGSVINRHTTFEPAINAACDRQLRSHRRAATVSLAGSAILLVGVIGMARWPRGREVKKSPDVLDPERVFE